MSISDRYNLRGVSASKEDVHNAIRTIDKGLFPKAFCKIIPDYLGGDRDWCTVMHADGAGTKSSPRDPGRKCRRISRPCGKPGWRDAAWP